MSFRENLKALRERRGLTQAELAELAGVPLRSLQNWEAGQREPRLGALVALALAFRTSVDHLLEGEPPSAGGGRRG